MNKSFSAHTDSRRSSATRNIITALQGTREGKSPVSSIKVYTHWPHTDGECKPKADTAVT